MEFKKNKRKYVIVVERIVEEEHIIYADSQREANQKALNSCIFPDCFRHSSIKYSKWEKNE